MIEPWDKKEERLEYECGLFQVRKRRSASPLTRKEHAFYVISTRPWVNVVAITPEKKILMVSQYRQGTERTSLEIPGGAMDPRDGSAMEAAKRELLEETGHAADDWRELGRVDPNPAIQDNTCHFFLAVGARTVAGLDLDEAEELEVSFHGLAEIDRLILAGEIRHSLVISAFYFLHQVLLKDPGLIG